MTATSHSGCQRRGSSEHFGSGIGIVKLRKDRRNIADVNGDGIVNIHETRITDEIWKLRTVVNADMSLVKMLQRPIPTLMEGNKEGHHLTRM